MVGDRVTLFRRKEGASTRFWGILGGGIGESDTGDRLLTTGDPFWPGLAVSGPEWRLRVDRVHTVRQGDPQLIYRRDRVTPMGLRLATG